MSDPAATSAYYAARPELSLDGQTKPDLALGLLSMMVEETVAGMSRCELTLGNWGATPAGGIGFLYFDPAMMDFGKNLKIKIGDGDAAAQIFDGIVTAMEGRYPQGARSPEFSVLAEDKFQKLRMARRTRTFAETGDADIFRQLASDHGLQAQVDVGGIANHKVLAQVNQSDLAFMRERARAIDAELWMDGSTLNVKSRSNRGGTPIDLTYGKTLFEFSVLADLSAQCTSFTAGGWDVAGKQAIAHEAAGSVVDGELAGNQTAGYKVLQRVMGDRKEQVVHALPLTDAEARFVAESYFLDRARRFITGQALVEGNGKLRPGVKVNFSGLGTWFDGPYYICEVRHTFDTQNGFRSALKVERPGLGT